MTASPVNLLLIVSLVFWVCGAIAFQSIQQCRLHGVATLPFGRRTAATWGSGSSITSSGPSSCISIGDRTTRQSMSSSVLASGPAILEKETIRNPSPAVLDRPATKGYDDVVKERVREGGEAWEVRIYNDGMNTREHVARSLVQITGMTEITAYRTMMQAHQNGIASVGRFCFEIAEMYNEGLRKQGIISDIVPVDEDV
jgi:ATP-dependent Clp protease adapter protein ClpS